MRIVISALRRQFPKFKKCLFLVFVLTIAPFLGLPRILILCLKGLVVNPFSSHITRGSCLAFGGPLDLWKALEGAKMWEKHPKKIQKFGNYHLGTKMTLSKILDTSILYFVISHLPILGQMVINPYGTTLESWISIQAFWELQEVNLNGIGEWKWNCYKILLVLVYKAFIFLVAACRQLILIFTASCQAITKTLGSATWFIWMDFWELRLNSSLKSNVQKVGFWKIGMNIKTSESKIKLMFDEFVTTKFKIKTLRVQTLKFVVMNLRWHLFGYFTKALGKPSSWEVLGELFLKNFKKLNKIWNQILWVQNFGKCSVESATTKKPWEKSWKTLRESFLKN